MSEILGSVEVEIRSNLPLGVTVIRHERNKYSIGGPSPSGLSLCQLCAA